MTEWAALLATVAAHPADDLPRLVLADWLEDRGRADLAAFIRAQVALEPDRGRVDRPGVLALHDQERGLAACALEQSAPLLDVFRKRPGEAEVRVRRGFPDRLSVTAAALLSRGPEARAAGPTIRRLRVFRVNGFAARLVKSDCLRGWPEVEFAGWFTLHEAEALANGRPLPDAQTLTVWAGGRGFDAANEDDLVGMLAGGRAWPALERVELFTPTGGPSGHPRAVWRPRHARPADADRRVAVTGPDNRVALRPDFPHCCPGVAKSGKPLVARPAAGVVRVVRFSQTGRPLPCETVEQTPALRTALAAGLTLDSPAVRAEVLMAAGATASAVRVPPFVWPDGDASPIPTRWSAPGRWAAAVGTPDSPRDPLPPFGHEFGYGGEVARLIEANEFDCAGRRYDALGRAVGRASRPRHRECPS